MRGFRSLSQAMLRGFVRESERTARKSGLTPQLGRPRRLTRSEAPARRCPAD